jgi:hypothetical protein
VLPWTNPGHVVGAGPVAAFVRKQKCRELADTVVRVLLVRECSTDDRSSGRSDGGLDGGQLESMSHENGHFRNRAD